MTIRMLWVGDAVSQTGFARVTHGILDQLIKIGDYEIHVLGVNYHGDPHRYPYKIYPATPGGDLLGMNRLVPLLERIKPDVLVLFNDLWVVGNYMKKLEGEVNWKGKIVTYFPVDSSGWNPEWMKPLYNIDKVLVYTDWALRVLAEAGYRGTAYKVPHGVDTNIYFPVDKKEARTKLAGIEPDDFVVMNANRNQPRKRIDITIKGFCKFAADKPDAKLYLHMGLKDVGWDIIPLMERECRKNGIQDTNRRLLITHPYLGPSNAVEENMLNIIYNVADVGVNTSLGEGWGLVNFEHSAAGVAQIVPDYAASHELYEGRALLLPVRSYMSATSINTEGGVVHEDDLAEALNKYYYTDKLRIKYAADMLVYVRQDCFKWETVAKLWDQYIKEIL